MRALVRFLNDQTGATAIEYGLIAALVAVGILATLPALRDALNATFTNVSDQLDAANTGAAGG
jgi:pilus assembly protein Flp/PilA